MLKGMLKRGLGVVAAAAMAVTGMAALSGTANAAVGDPRSITINNPGAGSTYTPYLLATFADVEPGDADGVAKSASVRTVTAWNTTEVVNLAVSSWNEHHDTRDDVSNLPKEYTGNPIGWVSTWDTTTDGASLRAFVEGLTIDLSNNATSAAHAQTGDPDNTPIEFTNLTPGWYLIVDSGENATNLLAATPITVGETTYTKLGDQTLGVVNAKPGITTVGKTADDYTVAVGQEFTFTLTGEVPNTIGQSTYSYYFLDTPGVGLDVDSDSVTVRVEDKTDPLTKDNNYTVSVVNAKTDEDGYFTATADNPTNPKENDAQLKIDLSQWVVTDEAHGLAGKTITVTYKAKVNDSALNDTDQTLGGQAVNAVFVHDGKTDSEPVKVTVKTFGFKFYKQNKEGENLKNATFTIAVNAENQTPGQLGETTETNVTTGEDGVVEFDGLAPGDYTITETTAPAGYMDLDLSFNVNIAEDGTVTMSSDTWGLVDNANKVVKNVRNVTELPLTGAAGTMLFTVLGLLIAGAGVTVYMKSRSVRKAMRA